MQAIERIRDTGFPPVPTVNPYWDVRGVTFEDPDGIGSSCRTQAGITHEKANILADFPPASSEPGGGRLPGSDLSPDSLIPHDGRSTG